MIKTFIKVRQKIVTISRLIVFVSSLLILSSSANIAAQTSSSPNYGVSEVEFGSGAGNASSTNYSASGAAGALGVGGSSSTNFRAASGFLSPSSPYLELIVNAATIDLGVLSTSSTATGNSTFSVRTYLSGSYIVQTISNSPTSEGGATLAPMAAAAASSAGTEQFGINLVANTSPATFGAVPVNVPDNTFADGQAASGYATANNYKYVVGDTIARSPATGTNQGIGRTDYTISYIANMAPLTEAGLYSMAHTIVVTATY